MKRQSGFTIIEVLMVLSTIGVIFLIVFLAIPTLTRNSRNSNRKQDAAAILQAVSNYELKNTGEFPECNHNCSNGNNFLSVTKLYQFDTNRVVSAGSSAGSGAIDAPNNTQDVRVVNYHVCDSRDSSKAISTAAGYRDVVVLFSLESGGNTLTGQCIQLQ